MSILDYNFLSDNSFFFSEAKKKNENEITKNKFLLNFKDLFTYWIGLKNNNIDNVRESFRDNYIKI